MVGLAVYIIYWHRRDKIKEIVFTETNENT